MKMRRLLQATLLASVLMTVAACGDSDKQPPDDPSNPTPLPTDPNDPTNATKDTDCDGLSDQTEFNTDLGGGKKTNPGLADTDVDGLPDGLELGIDAPVSGTSCNLPKDASAVLKTDPLNPDSDGDGLKDGTEDANKNGKADENETHPRLKDTDCDGLLDGPSAAPLKGEDQNANGTVDAGEPDPRKADSDGDGIVDGVELSATTNPDPTTCTNFRPDTNPATSTDPANADSDGDGVSDGAEDTNQNGSVDSGELDPQAGDASGPVGQVCTAANLRPVIFKDASGPDIKLALPPSFTEVTEITTTGEVGGDVKGLVGYDATNKVAFLAFRQAAPAQATDPLGDEEGLRPLIQGQGALTNRTAQRFVTWDGHNAVQVFYDQAGSTSDIKARTNALVNALVPNTQGRLSTSPAGGNGDFRLQALFVHRSNQSVVVLIAITQLSAVTGTSRSSPTAFSARDLSDGSALAQFGEPTAIQCERFQLQSAKVDFLFVVDDSGSMATSQGSLATAADAAVTALNASSLDWRMSMVTSSYHISGAGNSGKLRKFTRNVNKVKAWLTQGSVCTNNICSGVPTSAQNPTSCPGDTSEGANGGCWVSTSGNGSEGVLGAARKAVDDLNPGTAPGAQESDIRARNDAALVVVILGDADDQTSGGTTTSGFCGGNADRAGTTCEPVQNFINYFGNVSSGAAPGNETGKLITVHGIVCPAGQNCGCDQNGCEFNPKPAFGSQRHASVVNATGGVLGSISDLNSISASMEAIIADAIGNAGYKTLKPPIGASIKVAIDTVSDPALCSSNNNIPRSTVNGFDFDGSARTISFFGACRPASVNSQAAVSYQYWINAVSDPNGGVACEDDPNYSPTEPDHCTGPTLGCNAAGTNCVCNPNCGGTCGAGTQCEMSTCSCEVIIG